jgi:cytochrome c oxidase cbb3-type subunit III
MKLGEIIQAKAQYVGLLLMTVTPAVAIAAEAAPSANTDKIGGVNTLLLCLVGLMLILLYFIGMLANTLRLLSQVLQDKYRKERNSLKPIAAILGAMITLLATLPAMAADATAEVAAPVVSPFISGIPRGDFYAIMTMIALELIVIFALAIYIRILTRIISAKPEVVRVAVVKKSWFWDNFNKAVSLEKEKDVLLDHNYDGIQELDNSLPPWWIYGFYLTIIFAGIYLFRFHISHDGPSSEQEYVIAMEEGEAQKREYLAKSANNVDESTVAMLADGAALASGKDLYTKNCVACHLADGGGSVGPNLTDDYWLHGGGIKDIFKSIKYGWQEKGMKSWKDDFSPKQMQELASFVKTLQGTKPAVSKPAQGDLYIDGGAPKPTTDSLAPKGDSTKQPKMALK